MTTYGYARVSTKDQNVDRQMNAFYEWGLDNKNIFIDKASGKDFNRPAYKALIETIKQGDVLVIKSVDRMGRNYDEILSEWRYLIKEKQVDLVVLDMPLLNTTQSVNGVTGTLISDIVLELLSYVAHIERENIKQRQAEGIRIAQEQGVKFGRPRLEKPSDWAELVVLIETGILTKVEAAKRSNVSEATIRRWLKQPI